MPAEILSGEVYAKDELGMWRLILTSWGVPVVDNRTVSRPGGLSPDGVTWKHKAPRGFNHTTDAFSFGYGRWATHAQDKLFRMPYSGA